jgi:hypothetical protein
VLEGPPENTFECSDSFLFQLYKWSILVNITILSGSLSGEFFRRYILRSARGGAFESTLQFQQDKILVKYLGG